MVAGEEEEGCPVQAEAEGSCDGVAVEQRVCEPVKGL